ncbi:MAG: homoserine dehydrogenase [Bacteroidota bacterium]
MSRKQLNLGIFGFGCVGQGLYEALRQSPGNSATVRKICVRDPKKSRPLPAEHFTFDREELLSDPEIDVIVELIDDAEAAWEIVSTALKRGKAVVTANKKLLAERFEELLALQVAYGTPLLYEGAACASIPVIRNLEEYYDNDLLQGIEGIFNGSTNYILGRVENGLSYAEALAEAQEKGFAETDPRLDVGGYDPRYKLAILIAHAFGSWVDPAQILRSGIENIAWPEQKLAREKNWRLKLVARARRVGMQLYATVLPQFVTPDNPLYRVDVENNGVLLEGAFSQVQFFQGKGAGSLPTGSAVLSDISALSYDYRYEYRKRRHRDSELQPADFTIQIYLRYHDPAIVPLLRFQSINESYRAHDYAFVTGRVQLSDLQLFLARPEAAEAFVAELPDSTIEPVGARNANRVLEPV